MIDISSNDANEARAVFFSDYRGRFSDRNITNGSKRSNESVGQSEMFCNWLCLSDAWQVFDLPIETLRKIERSPTAKSGSQTHWKRGGRYRQVEDLPRIGVAQPLPTQTRKGLKLEMTHSLDDYFSRT